MSKESFIQHLDDVIRAARDYQNELERGFRFDEYKKDMELARDEFIEKWAPKDGDNE